MDNEQWGGTVWNHAKPVYTLAVSASDSIATTTPVNPRSTTASGARRGVISVVQGVVNKTTTSTTTTWAEEDVDWGLNEDIPGCATPVAAQLKDHDKQSKQKKVKAEIEEPTAPPQGGGGSSSTSSSSTAPGAKDKLKRKAT